MLKRPNMKDDPNYPFEFPDTYMGELEKYCDSLEKGIDKAVELIADYTGSCPYDIFDIAYIDCGSCGNGTEKCWKKYLFGEIEGE